MAYPIGTLNLKKVKDALFDWVNLVSGGILQPEQIIFRDQGEALPPRPCVTMKIIDGPTPIARNASLTYGPKTGPYTAGLQHEMHLSVQVFGNKLIQRPTAMQLTLDLNSSLTRQSILDKLKAAGVTVQELGKQQNLSALEESQYEERAGFDLTLGLVQNLTDEPGNIELVNYEFEVKDQEGNVVFDREVSEILP